MKQLLDFDLSIVMHILVMDPEHYAIGQVLFMDIAASLDEESNPVVMLVKYKKGRSNNHLSRC